MEYGKFPSQKHHDYLKMKKDQISLCTSFQLVFILIYEFLILSDFCPHLYSNWYHGFLIPKEYKFREEKTLEDKTYTHKFKIF